MDLAGHYDDRGLHIDVVQEGPDVEVRYYGVVHTGTIRHDVLMVPSLIDSQGSVLDNGDITFASGPYWRKHHQAGADALLNAAPPDHSAGAGSFRLDPVASRASAVAAAVAASHIDEMRKIMDSIFDDLDGLGHEMDQLDSGLSTLAPSSRATSASRCSVGDPEEMGEESEDASDVASAGPELDRALSRSESLIEEFAALLGKGDDCAVLLSSRGDLASASSSSDPLQRALDLSERILEDLTTSALLDLDPSCDETYDLIS